MSGKKTKVHKAVDGELLKMNKSFSNLKMKQKDKITGWVYEEYKKYVTENEKLPDREADAVDYKLISFWQKGEIVVSQDYGVAAMALGKGFEGIGNRKL